MVDEGDLQISDVTIDAFKKLIADSTSNTLDLPSTYPFSAERYRYNVNGTKYRDINSNAKVDRTCRLTKDLSMKMI